MRSIEQRTQLLRNDGLDRIDMLHQRIHRPQQLVVRDRLRRIGQADRLQPAQDAELRGGLAQAVEDHRAHQCRRVEPAARGTQRTTQCAIQSQFLPQAMQGKQIAKGPGCVESHSRRGGGSSESALQPIDQWVEVFEREFVESPEIGDDTLAWLAFLVAVGLDQLQVGSAARS